MNLILSNKIRGLKFYSCASRMKRTEILFHGSYLLGICAVMCVCCIYSCEIAMSSIVNDYILTYNLLIDFWQH